MSLQPLQDPDVSLHNNDVVASKGALPTLSDPDVNTSTEAPGFLKKLDMIGTGVDRGVKNFTLALMSKLPLGDNYQNAIKQVDANATTAQQDNIRKYGGLYPKIGEAGGEMLATLPVGGVFGKMAEGASALGKLAPEGLKTIAKYGSAAIGGAGLLGAIDSQKYAPNNPGQLINQDAAGAAINNPLSYAIPAVGQKLSTWLGASQELGEAKKVIPNIMARDLKEPGASTTLSNMFFGVPAALTNMGKQAKLQSGIGEDISNFVQTLAGSKTAQNVATNADKLTEYSANTIRDTLDTMKQKENALWDSGFKSSAVSDAQGVKDNVINAIDLLNTNKIPGYETTVNYLNNGIRKTNFNVEDVKKLQTLVSGAAINARGLEGGVGSELADDLTKVKDDLMGNIQSSISLKDMEDYSAASQFSASKFKLFEQAPLLQKAIYDETSAHKLVNTLTSEGGVLPPKRAVMGILSPEDQNLVGATKIQQALEASDPANAGHVNLDTFLAKTSDFSQSGEILNKDAYTNLQGLNEYLKNINEGSKVGWWRQAVMLGTLASTAGGAALIGGTPGVIAALASYGALSVVANHSPLKSLMNGLVNLSAKGLNTDSSSIYKAVTDAVSKHLTRAGLIISDDGVLQHKNEPPSPSNSAQEQQ